MLRNSLLGGTGLWSMIARAADDGGAGGAAPETPAADAAAATAAEPESVLFPNEGKKPDDAPAGDAKPEAGKEGDATKDDAKPAGWKEYENDPAKSEAENAAAKAEHDKTKPAADAADKVPTDGKYDLKMPDGVELDAELATALGPEFAELKLTNAQAQKLVDKYIEIQGARGAKQSETWAGTVSKWADDAKADKEIGGDKWDGTVKTSRRAVDTLGTPALKEYLEYTGGGNHPEMIRFMAKVGAMIKEDNPATGGAEGAGKPADAAHILFPNDAPKGS